MSRPRRYRDERGRPWPEEMELADVLDQDEVEELSAVLDQETAVQTDDD